MAAEALSRYMTDVGYTREGISAFLGSEAWDALARMSPAPAIVACEKRPEHPLSALIRCLWLGKAIDASAMSAEFVSAADELGIVKLDGDVVWPLVTLRSIAVVTGGPASEFFVASDLDELCGVTPLPPEHVLGVGGSTQTLISLLPLSAQRSLDLGTGCGVVALQLAGLSEIVIATDISEKALWFTRLNAALNGVTNIETRLGSLFEPVACETFDLIASNPPFVITPRATDAERYDYRDGGRAGDALMIEVVAGLAEHLTPGGQVRMLGNWEDASDRLDASAAGLSGFVIERERLDPARYAELWTRDGGTHVASPEGQELVAAWMRDFESRDVTGIGMGWVVLQKAPGDIEHTKIDAPADRPWLSEHWSEALEVQAWLADVDLLEQRLIVAADVVESRHAKPGAAGPNVIELRQGGALQRTFRADTALAALVGACDGELSVQQLTTAIAALLEVDADALTAQLEPQVRELVTAGALRADDR